MAGASELDKAVEKLTRRENGWAQFKRAPAVGGRPGAVTTGRPSSSTQQSSAFVEKDAALREYWPAVTLLSSDGLFSIEIEPIKKIILADDSAAEFKQPPPL